MPGQGRDDVRVVYDDFTQGEFGDKGPIHAPKGSFTGTNLLVYEDGLLGPRPGLKKHTITGNVNGRVWGLKYIGKPSAVLLVVIGSTVYKTSSDSDFTLTSLGALSAAPTEFVHVDFYDPNGVVYLTSNGEKTYSIDWSTGGAPASFTVGGADRGFRAIKRYRNRLYLAGEVKTGSVENRVWYSDASAFSTIGATNYFDVDYFWQVYALVPNLNNLLIPQRNTGWSALVGGNPVTGELRQIWQGDVPFDSAARSEEIVHEGQNVWYFRSGNYLAVGNGAQFDTHSFQHLQLDASGTTRWGIYTDNRGQDIVFLDAGTAAVLHRHWGVWVKHTFNVSLSGPMANTEFHERVLLVGGDGNATSGNYYSYDLHLGARPPFTSDTNAKVGDDSNTPNTNSAYFPWFIAPDGKEVRVRQLIVRFKKWDTGVNTNSFDAKVRTFHRENVDNYVSETASWTESASSTDTSGQYDTFSPRVGANGYGSAVQIGVENLIGVAIASITAVIELAPERPVA